MTGMISLEERIAHLSRSVVYLSVVGAPPAADTAGLTRRVTMLLEREAEREADGGSLALGDRRPPHW